MTPLPDDPLGPDKIMVVGIIVLVTLTLLGVLIQSLI